VEDIDNVFHYDIDDLQTVVQANFAERLKACAAAEKIVDQEVQAFRRKLKSFEVAAEVTQIQSRINEICRLELQRSLRKLGFVEPRQVQELEAMVARIAGKVAHPLIVELRNGSDPLNKVYKNLIQRLFGATHDLDSDA